MSRPIFELNDLRVLVSVHDTKNMSSSSEELATSRQTISKTIAFLETLSGQALFRRTSTGVVPTPYCDELYQKALRLFADLASIEQTISEGREYATFRVGLIGKNQRSSAIENLLSEFCQQHHGLRIQYFSYEWPDIIEAVVKKDVDFASSIIVPSLFPDEIAWRETTAEPMLVVSHEQSRFFGRDVISAKEIENDQIVLYTHYSIQADLLREYALEHGLSFKDPLTTMDVFLMSDYLESDAYTILLEQHAAYSKIFNTDMYQKSLIDPPFMRRSGIIFRKDMVQSALVREMFSMLENKLKWG